MPELPTLKSPVEISPFLQVITGREHTLVRDLVSGFKTNLGQAGLSILNALKRTHPSFAISEFLFSALAHTTKALSAGGYDPTFANIRSTPTHLMVEYLARTDFWDSQGNNAFAKLIAHTDDVSSLLAQLHLMIPDEPLTLFHRWKPGMICVSSTFFLESKKPPQNDVLTADAIHDAGWLLPDSLDIEMLVDRTVTNFYAIQNRYELRLFLSFLQSHTLKIVVEIGTARGGLLFCLCQIAAPDALLISIDLPGSNYGGGQTSTERDLFRSFQQPMQDLHFISEDSHSATTRHQLTSLLGGRAVDLLVIDGDHSYMGVQSDFLDYKAFMAPRGIIAFHDIQMFPEEWGRANAVGAFWRDIKHLHNSIEIIDPTGVCAKSTNGQTRSWGFGLIQL